MATKFITIRIPIPFSGIFAAKKPIDYRNYEAEFNILQLKKRIKTLREDFGYVYGEPQAKPEPKNEEPVITEDNAKLQRSKDLDEIKRKLMRKKNV